MALLISAARSLAALLGGSRRLLALTSALALAEALLIVPIGLLFRQVFDHTIPDKNTEELVAIGGLLVVLALVAAALALLTRHLVLGATKNAVLGLRMDLLERVEALPAAWADRHDAGSLHAMIVQDSERIDIMLNAVAAQLVPAVIITIGLSAAMIVLDPVLFLLLLPAVPFMLLVTRPLERVLAQRTRAWHRAFDRFSLRTHFLLRARSLITTYGTEDAELNAARTELEELRDAGRRMAWLSAAYVQSGSVITMIAAVVVLVVGGLAVAAGQTSVGSLISFYALAALARGHLSTIVIAVPEIISGRESLVRLETLLEADEPQPYSGKRTPVKLLPIVLREVHFGYAEGALVLRNASLEVGSGELVGIIGTNGAGKTTIAALILGLYRPERGSLLAAGVPFEQLDIQALRRRIAVVPQDPILFSGTIAENIAYGDPAPDRARIIEAARAATADAFIEELPRRYDTAVGDEGGLLSGGQRQRIAIARALLRAPELLILDEPTASLDQVAVAALVSTLSDVSHNRAVVVISHNEEVLAGAERVYQVKDGVAALQSPAYAASGRGGV